MVKINLIGQRFTRLTVVSYVGSSNYNNMWECLCDCGNKSVVSTNSLRRNNARSCGCLQKEKAAIRGRIQLTTHGLSKDANGKKTRLFRIWLGMKTRCYNKNVVEYPRYGGKGVIICRKWLFSYEAFYEWALASGYNDNLTIERNDVSGNYEPSNCTWIPLSEQANNRTSSRIFNINGVNKTTAQLAREYSISPQLLCQRLKKGWTIENAISKKVDKKHYKKTVEITN